MYVSPDPFEYAKGYYCVLPKGLPDRFYPEDENDMVELNEFEVICFVNDPPGEIRERFLKEYPAYIQKKREKEYVDFDKGFYKKMI